MCAHCTKFSRIDLPSVRRGRARARRRQNVKHAMGGAAKILAYIYPPFKKTGDVVGLQNPFYRFTLRAAAAARGFSTPRLQIRVNQATPVTVVHAYRCFRSQRLS